MTAVPPTPATITLPALLDIRPGLVDELARRLLDAGFPLRRVLVLAGYRVSRTVARQLENDLTTAGADVRVVAGIDGKIDEAWHVARSASDTDRDTLIGIGGGRVIDVAKLAGRIADVDVVSVPTSIANDGVSSPVASLRDADGTRRSHAARMPSAVLVDVDCVASAPRRTLLAGLGDLLSNLTAVLDWRLAAASTGEPFDEFSATLAEQAALPALTLTDLEEKESIRRLASGLVIGGLAMAIAGSSRPCSGAEHLVSHALDTVLGARSELHGIQVGFAALLAARLHGRYEQELRDVLGRCGFPTTCEELGVTEGELVTAICQAPGMRPGRLTVLDEIELADRHGVRGLVAEVYTGALAGVQP